MSGFEQPELITNPPANIEELLVQQLLYCSCCTFSNELRNNSIIQIQYLKW